MLTEVAGVEEKVMLLKLAVDYTYHAPAVWDWIVLVALELQCAIFLFFSFFGVPIGLWLPRLALCRAPKALWLSHFCDSSLISGKAWRIFLGFWLTLTKRNPKEILNHGYRNP